MNPRPRSPHLLAPLLAASLAGALAGCVTPPDDDGARPRPARPESAIEHVAVDRVDGGAHVASFLRVPGGRAIRLDAVVAGEPPVTTAAAPGVCSTTGVQDIAVIVLVPPGTAPHLSNAELDALFFGAQAPSLDGFLQDASSGLTSAAGAVFGPYLLDRAYDCDEMDALRLAAITLADDDVYFPDYQRLFLVFPDDTCAYNGAGTLACGDEVSADGPFHASTSWLVAESMTRGDADDGLSIVNHELGHNLGLGHANSRDWGPEAVAAPSVASTIDEYGDLHSTMGMGRMFGRYPHYAAPHEAQLGWLTPDQIAIIDSAGSHGLAPYALPGPGVRALKIRRPAPTEQWLWVEYRQPLGFYEGTTYPEAWTGALIHHQDPASAGRTRLLDFTPGSATPGTTTSDFLDAAMVPGTAWVDAYSGLGLALSAAGPDLAMEVSYGPAPCAVGPPAVTVASTSARAGDIAEVGVTVGSQDSGACPPLQAFSVGPILTQQGWLFTVAPDRLAVAWPGPGTTTIMRVTVPATATVGDYSVGAASPRGGTSSFGYGTVTIVPTVTASAPTGPVPRNTTIALSATVRNGGIAVGGVAVTLTLRRPDGGLLTKVVTTTAAGVATWSYKAKPPTGVYTLDATATVGGKPGTAPPVSFTVI